MTKSKENHLSESAVFLFLSASQKADLSIDDICAGIGIDPSDHHGDRKDMRKIMQKMADDGRLQKTGTLSYRAADPLDDDMNMLYAERVIINGVPKNRLFASGWNKEKRGIFPPVFLDVPMSETEFEATGFIDATLYPDSDGSYIAVARAKHPRSEMHLDEEGNVLQNGSPEDIIEDAAEEGEEPVLLPIAEKRGYDLQGVFTRAANGHNKGKAQHKKKQQKKKNKANFKTQSAAAPDHDKKNIKRQTTDEYLAELLAKKEVPLTFSDEALSEAQQFTVPAPDDIREDIRDIPLVTCDPVDARDFDDAMFAEPDTDPNNPGGYHLIVAIADVAHYVRGGTQIDKEAKNRGNSIYLPDKVIPMIPENLSNTMCSLVPDEDRACMAMHMWIDKRGELKRQELKRSLMRSHARFTYEEFQDVMDGEPSKKAAAVGTDVLGHLFAVYGKLRSARSRRVALDMDLTETSVYVDETKNVTVIEEKIRKDSHRLVEEMMVTANVAAANVLEEKNMSGVYRVHKDPPDRAVTKGLLELETMGVTGLPKTLKDRKDFKKIYNAASKVIEDDIAKMAIIRMQSRAYYHPDNDGHYGLALERYAHFTSPIRRYSDLLVHRALIEACDLGPDGLSPKQAEDLYETSKHISNTERRASALERAMKERFILNALNDMKGTEVEAHILEVGSDGIFVRLADSRMQGFVPITSMPKCRGGHNGLSLVTKDETHAFKAGGACQLVIDDVDVDTKFLKLRAAPHYFGSAAQPVKQPPSTPPNNTGRSPS